MKLRDIWHTLVNFGDAVERLKSRDEIIERLIRREVKDIQWRLEMLENNPDERRRRNTVIEQGGLANPYRNGVPVSPERALNAAAVLAEAIAKHGDKTPDVSPALEFYNAAGGYAWFKKNATAGKTAIGSIRLRTDKTALPWKFDIGRHGAGRSKSRCFATRRKAESFAFDVLTIHEAECIKRKAPTDWWNRVKIFEVIKR